MAIIKHIKIYNSDYDEAYRYLVFKYNEFTNKPELTSDGMMIPREEYLIEGINCEAASFGFECRAVNEKYNKNRSYREIKAHHYIISFDPKDKSNHGLTMEKAQAMGMDFAKRNFPGHQAIVCTHPDGHNESENIHVHIVINSVRKLDVDRKDFMEHDRDCKAGYKHDASDKFMEYLKSDLMNVCQKEGLEQVDLLSPPGIKITESEYWAGRKNKAKTDLQVLRENITEAMVISSSFQEFQNVLKEKFNIIVGESRGKINYLPPGRERPIRGKRLGEEFEKEFIERYFEEETLDRKKIKQNIITEDLNETENDAQGSQPYTYVRLMAVWKVQNYTRFKLIIDLHSILGSWNRSQWVSNLQLDNIQQTINTLTYLKKNGIYTNDDLSERLLDAGSKLNGKYDEMQEINSELNKIENVIKIKKQKTAGNEDTIQLKELEDKRDKLENRKKEQYQEFVFARNLMDELRIIQKNIETLANASDGSELKKETKDKRTDKRKIIGNRVG